MFDNQVEMKKTIEKLERNMVIEAGQNNESAFPSGYLIRERSDLSWYETAGLVALGFLGGIITGAAIYASNSSK